MTRLKILAVDPIHPDIRTKLAQTFDIEQRSSLTKDDLVRIIPSFDAVIGRTSTKLDRDVISVGTNLKCIGVHATGWEVKEARLFFFKNPILDLPFTLIAPHLYVIATPKKDFAYAEKRLRSLEGY